MNIKSNQQFELLNLWQIFDFGKRGFRIPNYQRGYSWETEQRRDLIKDIEYIIESGYSYRHYTGTIVATYNSNESNKRETLTFDIVDGQQRLTTLIILLSTIIHQSAEDELNKNIRKTFIADGEETGNSVRKFITGLEQDDIFKKIVIHGQAYDGNIKTKSDKNLTNAFEEFENWLKMSSHNIEDIKKCVLKHLGFLLYAPKKDSEIGIMFEVINNRGKSLSQLEKIKNYLIYFSEKNNVSDLKNTVLEKWPYILSRLNNVGYTSNEDEDRFLRNCWIVFEDTNKSKSYHPYEQLKYNYPPDERKHHHKLAKFVHFISSAALTYERIFGKANDLSHLEQLYLNRIRFSPQNASVIPLIIALYERIVDKTFRESLLDVIEKLNFRYYGVGIANRSDSGQGTLFMMAHKLYNKYGSILEETGEYIDEKWLHFNLINFVNKRANDNTFVHNLTLEKDESGDFYRWHGLKYFLMRYEEYLRGDRGESVQYDKIMANRDPRYPNDFFHREHIWALSEFKYVKEEDEPIYHKRRIGNFFLLKEAQNIKMSNHPVHIKVKKYWEDRKNDPNTLMIREMNEFYEQATNYECKVNKWQRKTSKYWRNINIRFLDMREEKLINAALEIWRLPGLSNNYKKIEIDFFVNSNVIYRPTKE